MNRIKTIILAVLLAAAFTATTSAQDYFLHTVTQGQGLYSISRMYGVTDISCSAQRQVPITALLSPL